MGDLSRNFSRSEFSCYCGCGFDTVDVELIHALEEIRSNFPGSRVIITPKGGCRCVKGNRDAGGKVKSQHLRSRGADFIVTGVPARVVQEFCLRRFEGKFGIGCYENFTHIDTRTNGPARW